jgi:formylglycine-generating enzyme required for sulfatase activity
MSICVITAASGQPQGNKWALLVGIDKYDNPNISSLRFSVRDVQAVARKLIQRAGFPEDNLLLLTSDQQAEGRPTDTNILDKLDYLARKIQPGDTFLFYFSGHGYRQEGKHFLATTNADPRSVAALERSSLPLALLREKMQAIKASQAIFIIDACRNDPSVGKGDQDNPLTEAFSRDLKLVARSTLGTTGLLLACSEGERAYEYVDKQQGVFTWYLLEALEGKGVEPSGEMTMNSVGSYVQKGVLAWSERNLPSGKTQTPEFQQFGGAERIVLGKARKVTDDGGEIGRTRINPKDGAEMVSIPAGEFLMGSNDGSDDEKPPHKVHLDGYWIYRNLVTVAQYRKFCQATGRQMPNPPSWGWKEDHPVVNVSWDDAMAYCRWAGGSLPTEAQWEKAARGTDGRKYPWGNEWDAGRLWCSKSQLGDAGMTAPVGSFPSGASPYGVLDMAGNVWQWCYDWYDEKFYSSRLAEQANPVNEGVGEKKGRVLRGGSWGDTIPNHFRAAARLSGAPPYAPYISFGFRCVVAGM